jgi:hypothetical protein
MKSTWPLTIVALIIATLYSNAYQAQVVINEGSNRNFQTIYDEDGDAEDWIELYNSGSETVNLFGYSLTDDPTFASLWTFNSYDLEPGAFLLVYCSGKNRYNAPPFHQVAFIPSFSPEAGWNTHDFDEPLIWDGVSDLVVNSCSYSDQGYTVNSIFNLSNMGYTSSTTAYNDYNEGSCSASSGATNNLRPNIQFNGIAIGNGTIQNCNTCYPAPYGNWYWCAKNQSLYKANELIAAGLTAGPIESLAWDVASTEDFTYTYLDVSIKQVTMDNLTAQFVNTSGQNYHTDFKLTSSGETVFLLGPDDALIDELEVNCSSFQVSTGSLTDASLEIGLLSPPTPGESNNSSGANLGVVSAPHISIESGVYSGVQVATIFDTSGMGADIYYTLNGDEPTEDSELYTGEEIDIYESSSLRARAYLTDYAPSTITTKSVLIDVVHSTPIVAIAISDDFLYDGAEGIFENWAQDWERFAQIAYFDSSLTHPLLFERDVAMQVDGGAGGSRSLPQHSFRLEMAKGSLAQEPVELALLPNRDEREMYGRLYFRNGSNMWLTLPYKDAAQVEMMMAQTKGYFSAMRASSVYINGEYFGLYEMREKLDEEYFLVYDGFVNDDPDVLSLSYWYNLELRATSGSAENYWESLEEFNALNPSAADFLEEADQIFDLDYLADYIIGESWMGNSDWPYNNIKISRNDASDYRWRFSTIDLELSLAPNGWTDCYFNGLEHVFNQGQGNAYTGPWVKTMENQEYREYFINRYADVMNTSYRIERLLTIENGYYDRWVLEMPNEYERWADPWNIPAWMDGFLQNHLDFQEDLICKSETVWDQVQDVFDLDGQVSVTLEAVPPNGGVIHINSITPESTPWDGIYYHGVPVTISAEPNEGYLFMYWESNEVITQFVNPNWSGELNMSDIEFTAVFESYLAVEEAAPAVSALHLYPNPVSSVLSLDNSTRRISFWEVFDMKGQLIDATRLTTSSKLTLVDTRSFSEGVYLLRLCYLDGGSENHRFVKVD